MYVFTSQRCLEMEHKIVTVNSIKCIVEMCFCVLCVHVIYDGNIDDKKYENYVKCLVYNILQKQTKLDRNISKHHLTNVF